MRRRDWLAGLVVGAWAGFLLVYVPIAGAAVVLAFAIPSAVRRSQAAIAGLLAGSGGTTLLMIALATLNCAGNFGSGAEGCTPPDLRPWFISGLAAEAIGIAWTARLIVTRRRGP